MRNAAFALALFLSSVSLAAEVRTYSITDDGKNYATFESAATLETIKGITTKVTGTIVADPQDIASSRAEVTIDLASIDTGIAMRNEHLRDRFLEVSKFPTATFKSVSVDGPKTAAPNKPLEIRVTGDFTIHGVTRRITVPVRVVYIPESELTKSSRGPGDWIHATATFPVRLADHGITVPERLILKLADTVDVKLDVFAVSRPPKAE
ncbi:MAG TPA: YceI family protein [Thermoanaerobaculia bacterium]|nr:YceI family protein [Thermoanaerobaculia bacterium]